MTAPRIEIDLAKIRHNARTLVDLLGAKGIAVTGVTKAFLGAAPIAGAMLDGGVVALGDSRVGNLQALRGFGVDAPMRLIRSPMLSQVESVVELTDLSCNTEVEVVRALSAAASARGIVHRIMLMVELGDLREGILVGDLAATVAAVLGLPNIVVAGIGTNLACQTGVVPDEAKMRQLSELAESVEREFGIEFEIVSGGNSANLPWALGTADHGRINDLRLGESILLGREPLQRQPIPGLHTDAFSFVAEAIEAKDKPAQPWGGIAETAFGAQLSRLGTGTVRQAILAVGRQDVDPEGLTPEAGVEILGASSDHLVIGTGEHALAVGDEVRFEPNYSALLRAMTSPFTAREYLDGSEPGATVGGRVVGNG